MRELLKHATGDNQTNSRLLDSCSERIDELFLTSGGSEGNLFGLYLAKELYSDGIVYYSEQTHYSVSNNVRVLKMHYSPGATQW